MFGLNIHFEFQINAYVVVASIVVVELVGIVELVQLEVVFHHWM